MPAFNEEELLFLTRLVGHHVIGEMPPGCSGLYDKLAAWAELAGHAGHRPLPTREPGFSVYARRQLICLAD